MRKDQLDDLEQDGPIILDSWIEVMKYREVWRLNLTLLPPQPSQKSGEMKKKKKTWLETKKSTRVQTESLNQYVPSLIDCE